MPKFALYYIPQADDPLYQLGTHILGYDVRARQTVDASPELEEVLLTHSGKEDATIWMC